MRRYGLTLLSEPLEPAGVAVYAIELARALAPLLERDERLVVLRHAAFPRPVAHERVEDVPLRFPLARRSPVRRLFEQLLVPSVALARGIDVLHAPNHVVPLLWPGPVVLSVHDTRLFEARAGADLGRRLFREVVYPASLRRAAATLADTEVAAREIAAAFRADPARFEVIHLGVNGRFATAEPARRDRPYVLHVGQHEPHKNVPRLVGAFAAALRAGLTVGGARPALLLAGSRGADDAAIAARIEVERLSGEDVVRLGYVRDADLGPLYRGARALAYPSLLEGFGFPPLEAFAAGVPVLAADIPVLRETAGDAALLVDPRDEAAIARGLARVVADEAERARLIALGRVRVEAFSWRRAAERTLAVYRRVARARR